eukprot:6209067-Pleurochrysis_carterae.AAC.1
MEFGFLCSYLEITESCWFRSNITGDLAARVRAARVRGVGDREPVSSGALLRALAQARPTSPDPAHALARSRPTSPHFCAFLRVGVLRAARRDCGAGGALLQGPALRHAGTCAANGAAEVPAGTCAVGFGLEEEGGCVKGPSSLLSRMAALWQRRAAWEEVLCR